MCVNAFRNENVVGFFFFFVCVRHDYFRCFWLKYICAGGQCSLWTTICVYKGTHHALLRHGIHHIFSSTNLLMVFVFCASIRFAATIILLYDCTHFHGQLCIISSNIMRSLCLSNLHFLQIEDYIRIIRLPV